jgi:hypothetical protein
MLVARIFLSGEQAGSGSLGSQYQNSLICCFSFFEQPVPFTDIYDYLLYVF